MRKHTDALKQKLFSLGVSEEEWLEIEISSHEFLKKKGKLELIARRKEEQERMGLISDLKQVDIEVDNIWDLVNTTDPYPEAMPVLLKHLKLPYEDSFTTQGIARALAVPEAKIYWSELLAEYKEAEGGVKDGLACALAVIAKATKRFHETLELLRDESLGGSRILLLSVISRSRNPEISSLIDEFADHPILGYETRIILKRRNKRKKT